MKFLFSIFILFAFSNGVYALGGSGNNELEVVLKTEQAVLRVDELEFEVRTFMMPTKNKIIVSERGRVVGAYLPRSIADRLEGNLEQIKNKIEESLRQNTHAIIETKKVSGYQEPMVQAIRSFNLD